jgi:hypothetical protein
MNSSTVVQAAVVEQTGCIARWTLEKRCGGTRDERSQGPSAIWQRYSAVLSESAALFSKYLHLFPKPHYYAHFPKMRVVFAVIAALLAVSARSDDGA